MSNSSMPPPPPGHTSAKKRKFDELDPPSPPPPPPPPPSGSVLYVTLYALLPSERRGGVLDYRWAFLLAPDAKPETRGRRYLLSEASSMIGPSDEVGSSKIFGVVGHAFEGLGLGQQERRFDGRFTTYPPDDKDDAQVLSASNFEIQDVSMSSAGEAQVRLQLPRVEDVEAFEALIKYAFLASDGARGANWNHVMWTRDAWNSLIEALNMFGKGGLRSELTSWETVQKTAMAFVKVQESKGRLNDTRVSLRVPTWEFLERRQLGS